MTAPTAQQAKAYLGSSSNYDLDTVTSAFNSEKASQARRCTVPADADPWPEDLVEALFRRVAHNLALRALPLGVSANVSEAGVATTRVGGMDAEVRRLEAPYRKVVLG